MLFDLRAVQPTPVRRVMLGALDVGSVTVLIGDAVSVLRTLPPESCQMCLTSPPYFGLRDYGTGEWVGGDPTCDHARPIMPQRDRPSAAVSTRGEGQWAANANKLQYGRICARCGARRIDKQLGQEDTPELYVERMVEVFREVKRVLRKDGVVFLNVGDGYVSAPAGNTTPSGISQTSRKRLAGRLDAYNSKGNRRPLQGIKQKDLLGIPWMLAFALRADGWWLRADIVWHKPNPMPESTQDRPTSAHEYVFLLSKSARYFYDGDAIAEPSEDNASGNIKRKLGDDRNRPGNGLGSSIPWEGNTRNKRDVWTIPTEPVPEAHFATMPTALARLCIQAGSSEVGACPNCGAPYKREVETDFVHHERWYGAKSKAIRTNQHDHYDEPVASRTIGWSPTCTCHIDRMPAELAQLCIKAGTSEAGACPRCGTPLIRQVAKGESDYKRLGKHLGDQFGRQDSQPGNKGNTRTAHGTVPHFRTIERETLNWLPVCSCYTDPPVPCRVLDPFGGTLTTGQEAALLKRNATLIELKPEYATMGKKRLSFAKQPIPCEILQPRRRRLKETKQ